MTKVQHRFVERIPADMRNFVLTVHADPAFEGLRQSTMKRRDTAVYACMLEIVVSIASMALYDLRRSILILVMNGALTVLSCIGLKGAMTVNLRQIQIHGIITTGLIIATILNFLCEAVLSSTGIGSSTLPPWVVLTALLVPYSLNLACSLVNLALGSSLADLLELEEQNSGLLPEEQLEQQAEELRGQDQCCVCMTRSKDAVLTPCGHKAMCVSCGEQLKARGRNCPLCRRRIDGVVRVYDA